MAVPAFQVMRQRAWVPDELDAKIREYVPKSEFGLLVKECLHFLPRHMAMDLLDQIKVCVIMHSQLHIARINGPWSDRPGTVDDFGIVSRGLVTSTGVAIIVDAFDNTLTDATAQFHALGTGATAEAITDVLLVTELTTQYSTDNVRTQGTFSQPASSQSRSSGVTTVDAAATIAEHGVFTSSVSGAVALIDRSTTGTVTLSSGDGLNSQYTLTFAPGG